MPRVTKNATAGVDRVFAVMETVASHGGMNLSDIARVLNLPKSSISYILHDLERLGYLLRHQNGGYKLSGKVVELGQTASVISEVQKLAVPVLHRIVERTGLSACLARLDGGEVLMLQKVDAPAFHLDDYVRPRIDVHATASGKTLLASLPEREREVVVSHVGMRCWTPNTITTLARFSNELQQVRGRGYATDFEEFAHGLRCVAAPIFDPLGKVRASIAVAGRPNQITDSSIPRIGVLVREAARMISDQLGYVPPTLRKGNSTQEPKPAAEAMQRIS